MNKNKFILILALCAWFVAPLRAQVAQNNPYVDDKIFHFGFQLGVNLSSFGVTDSQLELVRVGSLLPGFHIGFVTDLRLCRYLNLRFCPGMQFINRTISYKTESGAPVKGTPLKYYDKIDVLAMPVTLPLYLKWSAEREANYRPYVIAGGGVSINASRDNEKPILLNLMDYFLEVGFGVDLYARWFKFCPEITYRMGFANQLCPISQRHDHLSEMDYFYTNAISRLTNHTICLTFNFE